MPQDHTPRHIPTAKFFTDTWSIYEQILRENYMFHDEIYRHVESLFARHFGDRRISVLDLGCGDARYLARALTGRSIGYFRGIDRSATALDAAKQNLSALDALLELHEGDLLEGLQSTTIAFDLVFSSFAVHHLPTDGKRAFFQAASKRLNTDGILVLVDVMRNEEEGLPLYLQRYCAWLRREWTKLPVTALDMVCDHIQNNDLPETVSILYGMAEQAGFDSHLQLSGYNWHRTLCFENTSNSTLSDCLTHN